MWFDPTMVDENGDWIEQELFEYDVETGELVPIEGDSLFGMKVENIGDMIGYGEMKMVESYLYR